MSTTLATPDRWSLDGPVPRGGLLTIDGQPKTIKGEKAGYLTAVLHLSPADRSGRNVCPHASAGCRAACLNESGRGGIGLDADGMNTIQAARIRRTRYWSRDRAGFLAALVRELELFTAKADRRGLAPAVRLNGTSDLPWELWPVTRDGVTFPNIMEAFKADGVTFYDYTKWPTARRRKGCPDWPSNYSLTFSLSEDNAEQAAAELAAGVNVAAPFTTRKGHALPPSGMVAGTLAAVIDGDESDLRFTDPVGVIVGLRAKGARRLVDAGVRAGFILPA
jgi:hypothetical protein